MKKISKMFNQLCTEKCSLHWATFSIWVNTALLLYLVIRWCKSTWQYLTGSRQIRHNHSRAKYATWQYLPGSRQIRHNLNYSSSSGTPHISISESETPFISTHTENNRMTYIDCSGNTLIFRELYVNEKFICRL